MKQQNPTMKKRSQRNENRPTRDIAWVPAWSYKYLIVCAGLVIAQSARPQASNPMQTPLTYQKRQVITPLPEKDLLPVVTGKLPVGEQMAFDKPNGLLAPEKRTAIGPTGGTLPANEQWALDKPGVLQASEKHPATGVISGTLPASEQRVFDKTKALQAGEKPPAAGPAGGTLPASEQRSFDKNTPEDR
jgi:hypothetical protein